MHIGRVARKAGVSVDAIRFYEKRGLLRRPPRSAGGYRLYSGEDAATVLFIRRAQGLGFTLEETRELLALRSSPLQPCSPVRERLRRKLFAVRARIRELRSLERELASALVRCNRQLKKRAPRCPVLGTANPQNIR